MFTRTFWCLALAGGCFLFSGCTKDGVDPAGPLANNGAPVTGGTVPPPTPASGGGIHASDTMPFTTGTLYDSDLPTLACGTQNLGSLLPTVLGAGVGLPRYR